MRKLSAVLFFCLFFVVLTAVNYAEDSVKMNDGKKYKGVILDYEKGMFVIKINGKKYNLKENSISGIYWNSSDAELSSALQGEKFKGPVNRLGFIKLTVMPFSETVSVLNEEFKNTYKGNMNLFGIDIGFVNTKFHTDGSVSLMTTSSSGILEYGEPGSALSGVTNITTTKHMMILNARVKIILSESFPLVPYCLVGFGGALINDKLDSYPSSSYTPMWWEPEVEKSAVDKTYIGFTGRIYAGAYYNITDFLGVDISGGYFAMTPVEYSDPGKSLEDFSAYVLNNGISFKGGVRWIF
ncbi:MAG: hypothetical protein JXR81_08735 [Candidatus Goldbacteria bacterium]|nr:hypothetical protein [Candidatus Goldiibacteriota bacterium]